MFLANVEASAAQITWAKSIAFVGYPISHRSFVAALLGNSRTSRPLQLSNDASTHDFNPRLQHNYSPVHH
jgi:hypothetical protein